MVTNYILHLCKVSFFISNLFDFSFLFPVFIAVLYSSSGNTLSNSVLTCFCELISFMVPQWENDPKVASQETSRCLRERKSPKTRVISKNIGNSDQWEISLFFFLAKLEGDDPRSFMAYLVTIWVKLAWETNQHRQVSLRSRQESW